MPVPKDGDYSHLSEGAGYCPLMDSGSDSRQTTDSDEIYDDCIAKLNEVGTEKMDWESIDWLKCSAYFVYQQGDFSSACFYFAGLISSCKVIVLPRVMASSTANDSLISIKASANEYAEIPVCRKLDIFNKACPIPISSSERGEG